MAKIADSGERREFETGAVRDMSEGKGRFDLLPMCTMMRLARHYQAGAEGKYGERNWEKGIPCHSYADSALRHLTKYMDGWDDEDHLVSCIWNLACLAWNEWKRPDLMDIPAREGKNTFCDYGIYADKKKEDDEYEYELTDLTGKKWGMKSNGDGTNTICEKKEIEWVKEN